MDFYQVRERATKSGTEIFPDFIVRPSTDLMVRGGSFYAVWDEDTGLWSKNEYDVQRLVDAALYAHAETIEGPVKVRALSSYKSNMWKEFRSYVGNMPSSHQELDGTLAFADTPLKKGDYCSRRLPYSLKAGPTDSYEKLMGTLYGPEEREKLEWAIGSIVAGDSKYIQKFFVLYGEAGTGKSTFLRVLQMLFPGYDATFDAKALTGTSNAFATEAFKNNPLVAIQHDGDLSKIEDNTRLNSIVSHEEIVINEKYKSPYSGRINALLFIGTNQSVKITDAKSGLIRRLIDVHPTGEKLPVDEWEAKMLGITFELGAIAHKCLEVYRQRGMNYYSRYRPTDMIIRTDVFYNFLMANYEIFKEQDYTTLQQAWLLYKEFCDEGRYDWRLNKGKFRDELRNYWKHFSERGRIEGGKQVWNLYEGFKTDKLGIPAPPERPPPSLTLEYSKSLLDDMLAEQPAQYATAEETPLKAWARVTTTLSDLDTRQVHFVKPGLNHIVIDFDLKDADGKKDLALNLEEASKWPPTYAEFSKSASGVHLHYLYDGDVTELSYIYGDGIEVKVFTGDASLRRKLTRCNNIPVATISGGLPRKERRVLDAETMKSERALRNLIGRNLRKEIHPGTKSSVDFIWKILEDAWNSGMPYDVTDLRGQVLAFANGSTNHSVYCVKLVTTMKFASEPEVKPEPEKAAPSDDRLVIYDVEVYPNLFVVCWKYRGDADVVKMLNPDGKAIEELCRTKLIGFNNRRYDNHILYARIMGYNNFELFNLSQRLISGEKNAPFGEAYGLSYADVWDFSSVKQSLKRFQIELGLNHLELGIPWDQAVPEDMWEKVVDYCANDVITTEAVLEDRWQDFVARQILADLAGMTVNDTTQKLTAKIIFGNDRKPQENFKYTDLSEQFPGYKYDFGKSTYRGEEIGEGGYVYAEPGMYSEVAVLDVASMHPTSIELLDLFGPYTKAFSDLKAARIAIKRRDYTAARKLLDGRLVPYLGDEADAKALSQALKIVINIVYGLTAASFDNPFRDLRNKDNIVAKRGALFMVDLKLAVQDRGFQVVHIKTDSIKIPGATEEIIQFVTDFGKKYGYEFEHETTYSKFCLVNDAVYIAKDGSGEWHATGAQFAEPYVFKTLFSREALTFDDYCQTKTVTTALYLQFGDDEPHFVGRAGSFVPVKEGTGGGILLRGKEGKFHAVTGTKGYFWKEAAAVRSLGMEETIELAYYRKLADSALKAISQYGDPEWFRS
jgi:hypothetical protein